MITKKTIGVFGIGSSGCRALDGYAGYSETEQIVAVDIDQIVLQQLHVPSILLLGGGESAGLGGVSGDVELATDIVKSEEHMIEGLLSKVDLAILAVGFSGGTAVGMLPFIVQKANDLAIPTVVIGTTPFYFEGDEKKMLAENLLQNLEKLDCSVIKVNLSSISNDGDELSEVCQLAAACLQEAVSFIVGVVSYPGYIRVDYQMVKSMVRNKSGNLWFSYGKASGENRAEHAVVDFKANKLTNLKHFASARTALVCINSDDSLRLAEIELIMDAAGKLFDPTCSISMGTTKNKVFDGELVVNVLAMETRIEESDQVPEPLTIDAPQKEKVKSKDNGRNSTETPAVMRDSKFKGVAPTIYNGVNLDIPTYKRNGIVLD